MPRCFVIMPITTSAELASDYGDDLEHFEHVLRHLFEPALNRAGYDMVPPSVLNSQIIQAEIIQNLETADLVLCDISGWNANVFFELGIRVALDRPVALVKDSKTEAIPFDNALVSCHTYDASIAVWSLASQIKELAEFARTAGAHDRNALWRYFGITQRASVPEAGDPVQEQLGLILASLERLDPPTHSVGTTMHTVLLDQLTLGNQMAQLTYREREVLTLLALGQSAAEIATHLCISETTVRTHLAHVLTKLGVRDRTQAVIAAYRAGLVQPRSDT
jgi:DNA-binding CsgD family transcriptional regulator